MAREICLCNVLGDDQGVIGLIPRGIVYAPVDSYRLSARFYQSKVDSSRMAYSPLSFARRFSAARRRERS